MKELLKGLNIVPISKARNLVLFDTCFIVANLDNKHEFKELQKIENAATTSFNLLELLHIHHVKHNVKKILREFLKTSNLTVVDINVRPGEWDREREFVKSVDPRLLEKIKDASDAILIATAIKTHSDVATKDKHHLFTTKLRNFITNYGIDVYKETKDITNIK